jgi:hypothetical protein
VGEGGSVIPDVRVVEPTNETPQYKLGAILAAVQLGQIEADEGFVRCVEPIVELKRRAQLAVLDEAIRRYDEAHAGPPGGARSMLTELRREVQA